MRQEHLFTQPQIALSGRFIETPGFRIYYETFGDISRPALVLTHGGYQSSQCWRKQVETLSKKWFVIVWDMPFHGLSGPVAEEVDRLKPNGSFFAAGMDAVIETFHLRERGFALVAWSWGGIATNDYLLTYGPQGLRGLVYVAAFPDLFAMAQCTQEVQEFSMQLMAEKQQDRIEAAFQFIGLLQDQPPHLDDYLTMIGYQMQACLRPPMPRGAVGIGQAGESLAVLRESGCPVLCIHGAHDALIPLSLSKETCASVPAGELLIYEDCGHSPFFEQAERFNRDVDTFLSRCF